MRFRPTRTAVLAALCSAIAGLPGLAAEAPGTGPADPEPARLTEMQVTASRTLQAVQDVATAVTVLDRTQIERRAPQVLGEALRGEVGTYFQQTTPGQGIPIIRGLKGSQILHLVDGMRLNNAFFRDAPNQYLALVDAYNVQHLEVVRGPSSTLYGGDAMGGVVQVLTPEPLPRSRGWGASGRVRLALASADRSEVIRAEGEAGRRGLAFSGGFTYQDYDNRRTGSGDRLGPSGYRSRAADGKLIVEPGAHSDLMLSVQYLEQPATPRFDELNAGFGQTEPSSETFFFEPNERLFVHGRYRLDSPQSFVERVEIHLGHQEITDDRRTREFGAVETVRERNRSALDGLTVQLDSTLPRDIALSYGVELYQDEVTSSRNLIADDGSSQIVPSRFPDGSTLDSYAVYGHARWQPAPRWKLTGGLRYSAFDIELPERLGLDSGADLSPDDITGNFGVIYELGPATRLVANLGRGFRPPNVFDLGTLGARPGNRFNVANPDLDAESVVTLDVGAKFLAERWQAEVFGFYSEYDDKITSVLTGATTPDGRDVVRAENVNQLEVYGLEAGGEISVGPRVDLYGVLNYTRAEERAPDGSTEPGDRIPPLNGKLGARYRPQADLEIDSYILFADQQDRLNSRDERDPRIDPDGTAGWATLNVHLNWQARDALSLQLNLDNLNDKRYREHGSGIDAPGFNATLAVTARF